MSNTVIFFYPTKNVITPAPDPDVFYQISLTLTAFDQSDETSTAQIKSKSGVLSSSFYYSVSNYNCATATSGVNDEPETDEMEMFFASTVNAEPFQMTNLDKDSALMQVQMSSRRSRSRRADVDVGKFIYSFSVREVI
tara:strand:- start:1106 stop:1519 length:414 start_codon:yes stop_codon:yes gene_type:complete